MRLLLLLLCSTQLHAADLQTRLKWLLEVPLLGLMKFESHTPPTVTTATLGRLLFYDKRLSKDGTVSCASCHEVAHGFSALTAVSTGIGGQVGNRKAPPILNKAFHAVQFWDGRAETLEAQVVGPIVNPIEMGNTEENAVNTIAGVSGYGEYFKNAFGTTHVTMVRIATAVADYERTLLSGNSKFDKWRNNPTSVNYTQLEERGFQLFNDRECHICHKAPSFTDDLFHNTGLAYKKGVLIDEGRFGFTKLSGKGKDEEIGAFKTPSLRGLSNHGPYMHDGSLATLSDVVDFYNEGGRDNPHLDEDVVPLGLKAEDKKALVAFLETLEGEGFEDPVPLETEFPR